MMKAPSTFTATVLRAAFFVLIRLTFVGDRYSVSFATGIYFARLLGTGDELAVTKLVLLK